MKSSANLTPRTGDGKLLKRIEALKESLGGTQAKFAERIGASQTQVSEWLRGTEKPSPERLIAMGNAAPLLEDGLYFWRKAGISEARLKEVLRAEESRSRVVPDPNLSRELPIVSRVFATGTGELQTEANGSLVLPSVIVGGRSAVSCMQIEGSLGFPQPFSKGDYVVIERASGDLDALEGAMVAVFFEEAPQSYDLSASSALFFQQARKEAARYGDRERKQDEEVVREYREAHPEEAAAQEKAEEDHARRNKAKFEEPLVLLGRLKLEIARGVAEAHRNWKEWPSRIVLEIRPGGSSEVGDAVALTKWEIGAPLVRPEIAARLLQKDERISRPARIFGQVVGWLTTPKGAAEQNFSGSANLEENAVGRPHCKCGRRCKCICHSDAKYPHIEPCCGPGSKAHEATCEAGKPQRAVRRRES